MSEGVPKMRDLQMDARQGVNDSGESDTAVRVLRTERLIGIPSASMLWVDPHNFLRELQKAMLSAR
jgi:hypothetical protein